MAIIEQWHIRTRAHCCAGSGEAFAEGQTILAAIFPDPESSGYLRRDFSLDAWEARPASDPQPFSLWKSVYHAPQAAEDKPEVVKKENAEELLRRLTEEDEEHTENARYILAVMLERKKILRETDTQRTPTGILRIYEHRRDGDVFIIRDPNIPLDQIEAVQQDIIDLLEHGGRPPQPPIEQATEPAAAGDGTSVSPDETGVSEPAAQGDEETAVPPTAEA